MSEDTPEYLPASNNDRRIAEALRDLPEPFPTSRERGDKEQLARHLGALRARLDWLVKLEEEHGDQQKGLHHNRAERNALIAVLQQYAAQPRAVGMRMLPVPELAAASGFQQPSRKRIEPNEYR
ncbi:MAG: hypothetical protein LCH79_16270 [Proteobacteria bacterium]|nr:hypothetical protein [Pseudomonadota bacterium]